MDKLHPSYKRLEDFIAADSSSVGSEGNDGTLGDARINVVCRSVINNENIPIYEVSRRSPVPFGPPNDGPLGPYDPIEIQQRNPPGSFHAAAAIIDSAIQVNDANVQELLEASAYIGGNGYIADFLDDLFDVTLAAENSVNSLSVSGAAFMLTEQSSGFSRYQCRDGGTYDKIDGVEWEYIGTPGLDVTLRFEHCLVGTKYIDGVFDFSINSDIDPSAQIAKSQIESRIADILIEEHGVARRLQWNEVYGSKQYLEMSSGFQSSYRRYQDYSPAIYQEQIGTTRYISSQVGLYTEYLDEAQDFHSFGSESVQAISERSDFDTLVNRVNSEIFTVSNDQTAAENVSHLVAWITWPGQSPFFDEAPGNTVRRDAIYELEDGTWIGGYTTWFNWSASANLSTNAYTKFAEAFSVIGASGQPGHLEVTGGAIELESLYSDAPSTFGARVQMIMKAEPRFKIARPRPYEMAPFTLPSPYFYRDSVRY